MDVCLLACFCVFLCNSGIAKSVKQGLLAEVHFETAYRNQHKPAFTETAHRTT